MSERIAGFSLPNKVYGITVDLWGTLFLDSNCITQLQNRRIELLESIHQSISFDFNMSAENYFLSERSRFQEYERNGIYLPMQERIGYLTNYKLSPNDIQIVRQNLDNIASQYIPQINIPLVHRLKKWKSHLKIALISNTGMIGADVIMSYLQIYGIDHLFDVILFSENTKLCKPNRDIFFLASKKLGIPLGNLLHIGDSRFFDYDAALNAGLNALLINDSSYYEFSKQ